MEVVGVLDVRQRTLKGRRGDFTVNEQDAFGQFGDELRKVVLELEDGQAPYPIGKYKVRTALTVDQWGKPAVPRQLSLTPVAQAAKAS